MAPDRLIYSGRKWFRSGRKKEKENFIAREVYDIIYCKDPSRFSTTHFPLARFTLFRAKFVARWCAQRKIDTYIAPYSHTPWKHSTLYLNPVSTTYTWQYPPRDNYDAFLAALLIDLSEKDSIRYLTPHCPHILSNECRERNLMKIAQTHKRLFGPCFLNHHF